MEDTILKIIVSFLVFMYLLTSAVWPVGDTENSRLFKSMHVAVFILFELWLWL